MNYNRPELLNALAQRYVLGLLQGAARRRFERLLTSVSAASDVVYQWQERLQPLAEACENVEPSALVWPRIARRIRSTSGTKTQATRAAAWSQVAAVFAVVAITASIGWWQTLQREPTVIIETLTQVVAEPASISLLGDVGGQPFWITKVYPQSGRAEITLANAPTAQADKDYQLWALKDDGTPVSLGLLPQQANATLILDDNAVLALASTQTLAVSLEPLGGSPEDVPTGPVLYTGALMAP